MPLILIAGVSLSILLAAFVMQGMQQGGPYWLKSFLESMVHPHGNWLTRQALKPVALIGKGLLWIYHRVMHTLSVAASHAMHQAAHYFNDVAQTLIHTATTAGDFAADVAHGFERLAHHTIPHAIHVATAELYRGIDHLERDFAHLRAQLRAFERGIDRLIAHRVMPAIRALRHAIAVTIPQELGRIRARARALENELRHPSRAWIKRLARSMWAVALFGLLIRTLARRFPWLFCRKVKSVGNRVCGLDSDLLNTLLLDTLLISGTISIVQVARELQAIEGAVVGALSDFIDEL